MLPLLLQMIECEDDRIFMESLYHEYSKLIFSELYDILQYNPDIEDLMQSVFVKLIENIGLLRTRTRNQLVNYIIRTARNMAYMYLREKKGKQTVSYLEPLGLDGEEDSFSTMFAPDIQLQRVEDRMIIRTAWNNLPPGSRHILEMKAILEYSNEEIAAVLGVKPNSVRGLLSRARSDFRYYLKKAAN